MQEILWCLSPVLTVFKNYSLYPYCGTYVHTGNFCSVRGRWHSSGISHILYREFGSFCLLCTEINDLRRIHVSLRLYLRIPVVPHSYPIWVRQQLFHSSKDFLIINLYFLTNILSIWSSIHFGICWGFKMVKMMANVFACNSQLLVSLRREDI